MPVEVILLAVFSNHLRKKYQKVYLPEPMNRVGITALALAIVLFVVDLVFKSFSPVSSVIANLALFALSYLVLKTDFFKEVRYIVTAGLPFIVVSAFEDLVKAISSSLAERFSSLIDTGQLLAFVWLFAMLYNNKRQQKRIDKERLIAAEKEKELEITERLKAELEVQVAERTAELMLQKEELERTILDLKSTQDQLIHAEKMASLGELTAGIAHEIQNPLNFVNNFAEVNLDLLDEIKVEIEAGNNEEVIAIANDLRQNNEKIAHHGKRADSIVKGMLQHSRTSTGTKEPTDINALLDECIRLSYHGIRAKDKTFNANFKLNLDPGIGKISVVSQDIGRVFLNLFNNAFYAVTDRKNKSPEGYEPTVSVNSCRQADKVVISITDNGNGIPESVQEKIFQPFFTTKPTGKGTGLGLSISYDIIVKGHLGKINIDSVEQDYTTFTIEIPA